MSPQKQKILIVEDAPALAATYSAFLAHESVAVHIARTGQEAIAFLERNSVATAIVDVHLPDMSGLEILKRARTLGSSTEFIVVTTEGSIKLAVKAMRDGAFDFIVKPLSRDHLVLTVKKAMEHRLRSHRITDVAEGSTEGPPGRFIGKSPAMQSVYRTLRSAGPTNATVFITGESGVGKELCAEALHNLSKRHDKPFVALNCAAIPKDLMESEIFGHIKGAFTGASTCRKGAALQADGGTLFLDEIAEMDLSLQSKLLRFLQEKTVQRVGDDTPRHVDVRIICATNRDPLSEMAAGRFREDLFYRLHVVPVELPPLREREGDIIRLAEYFLKGFSQEDGKTFKDFSPEATAALMAYSWPGNIRQLQNAVRSVVVLNDAETVTADMLPRSMRRDVPLAPKITVVTQQLLVPTFAVTPPATPASIEAEAPSLVLLPEASASVETETPSIVIALPESSVDEAPSSEVLSETSAPVEADEPSLTVTPSDEPAAPPPPPVYIIRPLDDMVREAIELAIDACAGSIPRAAVALQVSASTIYRRMEAWHLGDAPANAASSEFDKQQSA